MNVCLRCCCLAVALAIASPALAQEHIHQPAPPPKPPTPALTATERPTLQAIRATTPVKVDGVMDEATWGSGPIVDAFIQQEPQEGQPATDRTEVRVIYNAVFLLCGVRL